MVTALATPLETGSFQSQQASETTLAVPTSTCRSHSREKKLQILKYYNENGRNKYRMCQDPQWPDVEEKLVAEFTELQAKGLKVKHYWFHTRAVQLMSELHQDVDFKFLPGWFDRFKARNKLSYRRSTNVAQNKPADMEDKIRAFHLEIRVLQHRKIQVNPWARSSCPLSSMWIRHHSLSLSIVGRATTKREARQFGIMVQPLVLTSANALFN